MFLEINLLSAEVVINLRNTAEKWVKNKKAKVQNNEKLHSIHQYEICYASFKQKKRGNEESEHDSFSDHSISILLTCLKSRKI